MKNDDTGKDMLDELENDTKGILFLSQGALAEIFAKEHAHETRYVPLWNKWFVWNGWHWEEDKRLQTHDRARKICRREARTSNSSKEAKDAYSSKTINAVLAIARSDPRIVAATDQWDTDPWKLNTPEGTYDLRTGERSDHDPLDYITKMTKATPEGDCPMWKAHLKMIFGGEQELIDYHERLFGYCLTGMTTEHSLAFAYGVGRNGKSATWNTLREIMGDYAQTARAETFTVSHNQPHPEELAAMMGARLVVGCETEEGKRWAESRIKQLTGGDKIRARFLWQNGFEYDPQMKLVFFGNHKPSLRSVNVAIRERIHLLPYMLVIPEDKRDKDFMEKLRVEWNGILAWGLDGCRAWQEMGGLKPPSAVLAATKAYLDSEDTLGEWLEDYLIPTDPNAFTSVKSLFVYYRMWAEDKGEYYVLSQNQLSQKLEERGFRPDRQYVNGKRTRGFCGLAISEGAIEAMRDKARSHGSVGGGNGQHPQRQRPFGDLPSVGFDQEFK